MKHGKSNCNVFLRLLYESDILNFVLLGSHDFSIYQEYGMNISKKLAVGIVLLNTYFLEVKSHMNFDGLVEQIRLKY